MKHKLFKEKDPGINLTNTSLHCRFSQQKRRKQLKICSAEPHLIHGFLPTTAVLLAFHLHPRVHMQHSLQGLRRRFTAEKIRPWFQEAVFKGR
jgi:hypothetical protein